MLRNQGPISRQLSQPIDRLQTINNTTGAMTSRQPFFDGLGSTKITI